MSKISSKIPELINEKELIENVLSKGKEWAIKNMKLSKFFLNSLSSYLFNLALSHYLKKYRREKVKNIELEKIGSNTKFDKINRTFYSSILKKEGIKLSDFKNLPEELKIEGHSRKIFFFPKNFKFQIRERNVVLEFDLEVGEYASLLLDFIFKNRLPPKFE